MRSIGGATSRILLVVDEPEAVLKQTVDIGAIEASPLRMTIGLRDGCGGQFWLAWIRW